MAKKPKKKRAPLVAPAAATTASTPPQTPAHSMSIVYNVIVGVETPTANSPVDWPASATFIRVVGDANGWANIYASSGPVQDGHVCVVRNNAQSTCEVHNVIGGTVNIQPNTARTFGYSSGTWVEIQ